MVKCEVRYRVEQYSDAISLLPSQHNTRDKVTLVAGILCSALRCFVPPIRAQYMEGSGPMTELHSVVRCYNQSKQIKSKRFTLQPGRRSSRRSCGRESPCTSHSRCLRQEIYFSSLPSLTSHLSPWRQSFCQAAMSGL